MLVLLCCVACAAVDPVVEPAVEKKVDVTPPIAAPTPMTEPPPMPSNEALSMDHSEWSGRAQEVLVIALSLTGVKYRYGGDSPETGFDCSGFVRYVFQQAASLTLPHSTRAISKLGQVISMEQLQPGDLVFFDTLKSAFSHVGIYLGSDRFIHAPSAGGSINVVSMHDTYWAKRYNGARRLEISKASAD